MPPFVPSPLITFSVSSYNFDPPKKHISRRPTSEIHGGTPLQRRGEGQSMRSAVSPFPPRMFTTFFSCSENLCGKPAGKKISSLCCILFFIYHSKRYAMCDSNFSRFRPQRPQKDTKTTKNRDFQVFFFEGSSIDEFVVRSEN